MGLRPGRVKGPWVGVTGIASGTFSEYHIPVGNSIGTLSDSELEWQNDRLLIPDYVDDANSSVAEFLKERTVAGSPVANSAGDLVGQIEFFGYNSAVSKTEVGRIETKIVENTNMTGNMRFYLRDETSGENMYPVLSLESESGDDFSYGLRVAPDATYDDGIDILGTNWAGGIPSLAKLNLHGQQVKMWDGVDEMVRVFGRSSGYHSMIINGVSGEGQISGSFTGGNGLSYPMQIIGDSYTSGAPFGSVNAFYLARNLRSCAVSNSAGFTTTFRRLGGGELEIEGSSIVTSIIATGATQPGTRMDFNVREAGTASDVNILYLTPDDVTTIGDLYINSDSRAVYFGVGRDSSISDNGTNHVIDFDAQGAGSRYLTIESNGSEIGRWNANGLMVGGVASSQRKVTIYDTSTPQMLRFERNAALGSFEIGIEDTGSYYGFGVWNSSGTALYKTDSRGFTSYGSVTNANAVLHVNGQDMSTLGSNIDLRVEGGGTVGKYTQIGLGWGESTIPPVVLASKTTDSGGATKSDFLIATRDVTTSISPTARLWVRDHGEVEIPTNDLSITSDSYGLKLGAGQDSSIIANGTNQVVDFDAQGAGSRYLTIEENGTEVSRWSATGLKITDTANDANSHILEFVKDRGAAGQAGDDIGYLKFTSQDNADASQEFANISVEIADPSYNTADFYFRTEAPSTGAGLYPLLKLEAQSSSSDFAYGVVAGGSTDYAQVKAWEYVSDSLSTLGLVGRALKFTSNAGLSSEITADGDIYFYGEIIAPTGPVSITSDTNGHFLGAGKDSSVSDNGSNHVIDFDTNNVGGRFLTIEEFGTEVVRVSHAAEAIVHITQDDVDEPFMKFIGTASSTDIERNIVAVGDVSTAPVAGYIKVEVQDDGNQITDQDYFIAVHTLT